MTSSTGRERSPATCTRSRSWRATPVGQMAPADATSGPALESAHALAAGAVATAAGVDPRVGLSSRRAQDRAAEVGPNELSAPDPPKVWRLALRSATQPFVLVLFGAGIAAAVIGEVRDG